MSLLDPSPNDCVFSLDPDLSLSGSSSLNSNDYESYLEENLQADIHVVTSPIPFIHPLNTPKTIQTPSSLFDSLLVYYAMLLISNGFKPCLFFTRWLSMKLFMLGIMLHIFVYILKNYGSDIKSIHYSYFYIH